jgi:MFS family permease
VTVENATAPSSGTAVRTHREILIVFSGLMLGMLLAAIDQTIVSTALPTIVGELGGLDHLSWVVTAYLLTSTASTPLYGKLGDLYGRKKLFQLAIVIFLVGSVLAGLSQNMVQLIAFRAVQGLGAGGLMSLGMAIIGDLVSPRERGRYTGYMGGSSRWRASAVRWSGASSSITCPGGGCSTSTSPSEPSHFSWSLPSFTCRCTAKSIESTSSAPPCSSGRSR